jgi:predicted nucleotidyltransferase
LNFTLTTTIGDVDLLGEVAGGEFDTLLPSSTMVQIFNVECHCVSLEKLIELKRAAGRVKDLEAIAELEILRDELN